MRMRELSDLSLGERVAWYRRRRGMSQEVLAGLVGRTVDWLSKVENDRIPLDRLSVIRALADTLRISVAELIEEPTALERRAEGDARPAVSALRELLMDYRQITPVLSGVQITEPANLNQLRRDVAEVWEAYQQSRYNTMLRRLPMLLLDAQIAAHSDLEGDNQQQAIGLLALAYQAAAMILTKLGETDLAWIAADRGLAAAQRSGQVAVLGSLLRSVTHALLSNQRYGAAIQLTQDGAAYLRTKASRSDPAHLSMYGTLLLTGSMAAARVGDRATVRDFLGEADRLAAQLGGDANHMWTAFGPTNVAIHEVATAVELGDIQIATDLGMRVETKALPIERRARHAIDVARAYTAWNRPDDALTVLLDAEQMAPEQVRNHVISRQLALTLLLASRRRPSHQLRALARRLGVD